MTNTAVAPPERRLYQFDEFRVDPVRRLLLRDGEQVPVTPKALSILLILLERPGQVVEKSELIEGVWPGAFVTEANLTQNISSLRKALGERANDRRYVVTVPSQGYTFVAEVREVPAEEAAPAPEPSSSSEKPAAVSRQTVEIEAFPPAPARPAVARPIRRGSWLAIPGVILLLTVALFGWLLQQRSPPPAREGEDLSTPASRRPSVAVLGFRNLSQDVKADWLGPALAEMLTTELGAGSRVRVISGENVARARRSLGLPYADSLDKERLERVHSVLGAELAIVGSYVVIGEGGNRRLRLDLRVLEMPEGEVRSSVVQMGTEGELFALVSRVGTEMRRTLGIADLSPEQARQAEALRLGSSEAARLYTQGLARLRAFDPPRARDLLEKAAQADPESALIRSALSQAWSDLGYDTRAVEAARKAAELSTLLSREDRLAIEARLHQVSKEWGKASEIYRSLWTFFPDDVEYGLQLVKSLMMAGRGDEAAAAIAALRKLPPPAGEDPRIDLAESKNARRLSDIAGQMRAAKAAVEKGRRSREVLIVAQALVFQGDALIAMGRPKESVPLFQESRDLSAKNGFHWAAGMALANLGVALQRQGDLDGAEKTHRESLAIAQRLGTAVGIAAQLQMLGMLHQDRGELDEAVDLLKQARSWYVRIEDRMTEAWVLNHLGMVLWTRGDLAEAVQSFERAAVLARQTGNRANEARALYNLGVARVWQGRLAEARRHQKQAFQILRGLGDRSLSASAMAASADILIRLGDLSGARQRYDQALAGKREAGDRIGTGQVLGGRASFAYLQGDLASVRKLSQEQLQIAGETGSRSLRAWALQGLGRADLAAGDLARARKSLEESLRESGLTGERLQSVATRLELARLAIAEGGAPAAAFLAREAASWYGARGISAGEAPALAVLAEALLLQGDLSGARQAADQARALVEKTEDRELRAAVAPALARVDAASGQAPRALQDLRQAVGEAASLGLVAPGLEARLALGEIQVRAGSRAQGTATLQALRREAEERGFRLLALNGQAPEPGRLPSR
ncbi:MAG TPA: tetratricopeptide repeat protein [Thermoanaerobaculia bacterium]